MFVYVLLNENGPRASCLQLFSHGSECHRSCSTLLISLACSFRHPPWKESEKSQLRKIWLLIGVISKIRPNNFHPISPRGVALPLPSCYAILYPVLHASARLGKFSDPRRASKLLHDPIITLLLWNLPMIQLKPFHGHSWS